MSMPTSENSSGRHGHEDPSTADREPSSLAVVTGAWALALILTAVLAIVTIWQVNERLYTPQNTAENYWSSLEEARGGDALGMFDQRPSALDNEAVDHLLLSGDPLRHSTELISQAEVHGSETSAEIQFTAAEEEVTTAVPMSSAGTSWGFFDDWRISSAGLTWFEVQVPGAPQGGIGQIEVNGEPVNLSDSSAQLSAFVPTVAEISVDSQWLSGSTTHVVTAPDEDADSAEAVTLELEASEAALDLLHTEINDFFTECAEQAVLMPSNCPVGISTTHRVNSDTISWDFPDAEEFSLTFDGEGWDVSHDPLTAQVSFDARHFHTGEQLTVTEDVPFEVSVRVGASGEDLRVVVSGE